MRFGRPITSIVGSSLAVTAAVVVVVFSIVVLNTASDNLDPSLFGGADSGTQKPNGLNSLSLPTTPRVSSTRQTRVFPSSPPEVLAEVTAVTAAAVEDTPLEPLTAVRPSSDGSESTPAPEGPGDETTHETDEPKPGESGPAPADPDPKPPGPGDESDESEWRAVATGWAHRPPHEPPTEAGTGPAKTQSTPSASQLKHSPADGRGDEPGPARRPAQASQPHSNGSSGPHSKASSPHSKGGASSH
jgi:hypothetical protein